MDKFSTINVCRTVIAIAAEVKEEADRWSQAGYCHLAVLWATAVGG
jgi:hypothetical protein